MINLITILAIFIFTLLLNLSFFTIAYGESLISWWKLDNNTTNSVSGAPDGTYNNGSVANFENTLDGFTRDLWVSSNGQAFIGNYYNNYTYNNAVPTGTPNLKRLDTAINFNWNGASPGSPITASNFFVRWTGTIKAPGTGTYTFTATTDDGVKLWVNNQEISLSPSGSWSSHPATAYSGTINLTQDQNYPIKMEYFQGGGGSSAKLEWSGPGLTGTQLVGAPNTSSYLKSSELNTDIYNSSVPTNTGFTTSKSLKCQFINPFSGVWNACVLKKGLTSAPVGYTVYFWGKGYVTAAIKDWHVDGSNRSQLTDVVANCSAADRESVWKNCNNNQPYGNWKLFKMTVDVAGHPTEPWPEMLFMSAGSDSASNESYYDLIGTYWVYGKTGNNNAADFNGKNTFVSVPDSSLLKPNQITVSAWVYPYSLPNWATILLKSSNGDWANGYGLAHYSSTPTNNINFFINNYNDNKASGSIPLNTWSHVAGTYDGANIKLYINGNLANSFSYTSPINNSSQPLLIGQGDNVASPYYLWHGIIDEVRIFNTALTQQEIVGVMNNTASGSISLSSNICNYYAAGVSTCNIAVNYSYVLAPYGVNLCNNSTVFFTNTSTSTSEQTILTLNPGTSTNTYQIKMVARANSSDNTCNGNQLGVTQSLTVEPIKLTAGIENQVCPNSPVDSGQQGVSASVTYLNTGNSVWADIGGDKLSFNSTPTSWNDQSQIISTPYVEPNTSKTFTIPLTIPQVFSQTTYTLNWKLKRNDIGFGPTFSCNLTVNPSISKPPVLKCPNPNNTIQVESGLISAVQEGNLAPGENVSCILGTPASIPQFSLQTYNQMRTLYYTQAKPTISKQTLSGDQIETAIDTPNKTSKIYWIKGNLTLTKNIDVDKTEGTVSVVFVDGNLFINTNQSHTRNDAGLVLIVNGSINIAPSVKEVDAFMVSYGNPVGDVAARTGFCDAYQPSFYPVQTVCQDVAVNQQQLTINGSVIYLKLTGTPTEPQFVRQKATVSVAAETLNYQPKYLVILKNIFSRDLKIWKEVQ